MSSRSELNQPISQAWVTSFQEMMKQLNERLQEYLKALKALEQRQ